MIRAVEKLAAISDPKHVSDGRPVEISVMLVWILYLQDDHHKDDLGNSYSHFRNY